MPISLDPKARLEGVLKCVKDAAADTVGMAPLHAHRRYTQDPLIAKLSARQRALRLCIDATGDSRDRTNGVERGVSSSDKLTNDLRDLACHRADILALEITSTDDSRKISGQ